MMSVDELKVLLQGCYTHRLERCMPKSYFDLPIKVARWFSSTSAARASMATTTVAVVPRLPRHDELRPEVEPLSRRNVETWVSYCLIETPPPPQQKHDGGALRRGSHLQGLQGRRGHQAPRLLPRPGGQRDGLPRIAVRNADHVHGLQRFVRLVGPRYGGPPGVEGLQRPLLERVRRHAAAHLPQGLRGRVRVLWRVPQERGLAVRVTQGWLLGWT